MKRKKPARYVRIDRGYGCYSDYHTVKVIDEMQCRALFSSELKTCLLVELAGGERERVDYWEEIPAKTA